MRLRFCSVTTLDSETKKIITQKMSWEDGLMRNWLREQTPFVKLCLVYNGQLATWAALHLAPRCFPDVGVWTRQEYRKRGYAHAAIWALLEEHKIDRRRTISVHHCFVERILNHLKYKVEFY